MRPFLLRHVLRTLRRAALIALPLATLTALQPASEARADTGAAPIDAVRQIPFLTLRNNTGSEDPRQVFGDERSPLSAGYCRVRARDLGGLGPVAAQVPPFLQDDLLRVDRVEIHSGPGPILHGLQSSAGPGGPVLYLHGYYISFEKGCRRAVLLQQNAQLNGRFLWFSWPSDGALTNYTRDEADLYWSVPDIAAAILDLERQFGAGVVDVVGHSLGARGVVLGLVEAASRDPGLRLGDVVLLAPDMDFAIFARILPRIRPIVDTITVYVTSDDRPLALSAQLHGYPRLGEAGNDVSGLSGVEVIDLTDIPEQSPTGHLYHIYSKQVGADLDQLLNAGQQAAARRDLERAGENLWRMLP